MKDIFPQMIFTESLSALGFEHKPLDGDDKKSPEIRRAFPFGRFIRATKTALHQVEIQCDRKNPSKIRLNLCIIALEGFHHPHTGHVKAEDAWAHYLPSYFEMYKNRFLRRWFDASDFNDPSVLIAEINNLFLEGKIGKHIRKIKAYTPQDLNS